MTRAFLHSLPWKIKPVPCKVAIYYIYMALYLHLLAPLLRTFPPYKQYVGAESLTSAAMTFISED